jgi:hypothetical protein
MYFQFRSSADVSALDISILMKTTGGGGEGYARARFHSHSNATFLFFRAACDIITLFPTFFIRVNVKWSNNVSKRAVTLKLFQQSNVENFH